MDSKGDSLWRVEGTQYPPYIAPFLREGLGQFRSADSRKSIVTIQSSPNFHKVENRIPI